ncbi:MAG: response regulator transcription factor [Oscillochloris sp.]|nr:response regulator transcription factor [Oscillochloris sp.]
MAQQILVVDDDREITRLVRAYLEQAGFEAVCAHDGASALRMLHTKRPDLLILDLMLPDCDGMDIARKVRADPSDARLPIIMLTARVDDTDRIVGLELGADDYVTKPFNPREVVARVRAVLRRSSGAATPNQRLQHQDLVLDLDAHRVTLAGAEIVLTPTEFDLLALFLHNPGHAFTRTELIEQGLGYAYAGMERTVDSHIKNLRKKIEIDSDTALIETVYGVGYRLRREPER